MGVIVKICLSAWQVLEIDSLGVSKGLLQKISVGNYGFAYLVVKENKHKCTIQWTKGQVMRDDCTTLVSFKQQQSTKYKNGCQLPRVKIRMTYHISKKTF